MTYSKRLNSSGNSNFPVRPPVETAFLSHIRSNDYFFAVSSDNREPRTDLSVAVFTPCSIPLIAVNVVAFARIFASRSHDSNVNDAS